MRKSDKNQAGADLYTYIKNNDEKEINVRNVVELQPHVVGNEREGCIFGGSDFVSGIRDVQLTFFITLGFGNWDAEIDPPIRP